MQEIKILMAEDNPGDVLLVEEMFRWHKINNSLVTVGDGEKVLKYFFERAESEPAPDVDLILLDINLPKVGGVELLQRLKSSPLTNAIPVVMFSSSELERAVIASHTHQPQGYIIKPLSIDKLHTIVEAIDGLAFSVVKH